MPYLLKFAANASSDRTSRRSLVVAIQSEFITKMITNAKKIFIETERTETLVLRLIGKASLTAFCEACGAEVKMLDLDSAVNCSGRTARELIHEIESGAIHSSQIASGHLLVCETSLLDFSDSAGSEI